MTADPPTATPSADDEVTGSADVADIADEDAALLGLMARGHTTAGVAGRLGVSERTVRRRLRAICDDLDVGSPIEAVVLAVRQRSI